MNQEETISHRANAIEYNLQDGGIFNKLPDFEGAFEILQQATVQDIPLSPPNAADDSVFDENARHYQLTYISKDLVLRGRFSTIVLRNHTNESGIELVTYSGTKGSITTLPSKSDTVLKFVRWHPRYKYSTLLEEDWVLTDGFYIIRDFSFEPLTKRLGWNFYCIELTTKVHQ